MNTQALQPSTKATRMAITMVVFIALSAAGALIKIPSPVGSIALDSAPGYFAAAYFSPIAGGVIGLFGHLASAATAGFPLGLWHLFVALHMFCWCSLFGIIAGRFRRDGGQPAFLALATAATVAVALNGVVSPYLLVIMPGSPVPYAAFKVLMLFLLAASAVDVTIASVAFYVISKSRIRGL